MKKLTVLSRSYCHLCDDMVAGLQSSLQVFEDQYVFDVVDIDLCPALEARWGDKVPVLLDGDIEICHYFLDADRLRQCLSPGE
ncbi:MAG: glutaredoxin family protein [Betaproteobacteria bacterium]